MKMTRYELIMLCIAVFTCIIDIVMFTRTII